MLHCGLPVGEVRLSDLDMEGRKARSEPSKGLKDRVFFSSRAATE